MNSIHFTLLISKDNFDKIEENDNIVTLASKEIWYSDEYLVAELMIQGKHEDLEPEHILNSLGGLVFHEDGTNGFLMLETDITETTGIYAWEGAMGVLMGDMLTVGDKATLLMKKRDFLKITSPDIYICVNSDTKEFKLIKDAVMDVFADTSSTYRFGLTGSPTEVWWQHLLGDVGGYYFIIQREKPEEKPEATPLLPAPKHSVAPPGNYLFNDDYDYDDIYGEQYMMWMRGMI